jgi:ribosome-associated translation inhibitor RaiA
MYEIPYPGSKWLKHVALQRYDDIQRHLPDTARLSPKSIVTFLKQYGVVYLKPSLGGGGKGVIRIRKLQQAYKIDEPRRECEFPDLQGVIRYIGKRCRGKRYLIQQGISLLMLNRRPVDFRALLYKKHGQWHYAGIMGKVAAANRFTTNRCSGGQAMTLKRVLSLSGETQHNTEQVEDSIRNFSLRLASRLEKHFPNITELGLDIALDLKGRIWLIEANTKPHYKLFQSHSDPSLYASIDHDLKELRSRRKR